MTLRITHVNLARGFRGGERQTELLIRALASQGVIQQLVCRATPHCVLACRRRRS